MSMHTPGPWVWSNVLDEVHPGAYDKAEISAYGPINEKGEGDIYDVLQVEVEDDGRNWRLKVSEPDAWLIIAAPDLLEACRAALPEILNHEMGHSRQFVAIHEKLDAAIAKAEGRS
jgi:hypothetical protein